MIAKMKKMHLVHLSSQKDKTLKKLGKLGVMHIEDKRRETEDRQHIQNQIDDVNAALGLLNDPAKVAPAEHGRVSDAMNVAAKVISLGDGLKEHTAKLNDISSQISSIEHWGEFDPADFGFFADKNIYIHLYETSEKQAASYSGDADVYKVFSHKGHVGLALISKDSEKQLEIPELLLPTMGLEELKAEADVLQKHISAFEEKLKSLKIERPLLQRGLEQLQQRAEFAHAESNIENEGAVSYLTGYIPTERLEEVIEASVKNGWGLVYDDPAENDHVPTLLKKNKIVSVIDPLFELLSSFPGYRERDISVWFLSFFFIFVGLLVGDAGYGAVLMLISGLGLAGTKGNKTMLFLFVLSFSIVGWGAVMGNWFGSPELVEGTFLQNFVIPSIYSHGGTNNNVIYLSFFIGVVHLSLAHLLNFFSELKTQPVKAFAQLGRIAILIVLFHVVLFLILRIPLPDYTLYLTLGGLGIIALFAKQEGNFFIGLLKGIVGTLGVGWDAIGAFSDIVSYIRLFAVGLASVEIAKAFNAMAGGVAGAIPGMEVVMLIPAILIMFFGHTLNLILGALAVIVHGVRLNMLEFSNHVGLGWSGFAFKPFKFFDKSKEKEK